MLAKGSFCRFFCDGLVGLRWDGMVRRAIVRGICGDEFWERVHVLNRLVRDMLVGETKIGLSFRAILPVTPVNPPPQFVDMDTDYVPDLRARYFSYFSHSRQRFFPFDCQRLSRGYRCATVVFRTRAASSFSFFNTRRDVT